MRYILFLAGLLCWFAFAYDIENDRDFMTWIWLLTSQFFFTNSYVRYKHDIKKRIEDSDSQIMDMSGDQRKLLIDFLNYCQSIRQVPKIDVDNTSLVEDFLNERDPDNHLDNISSEKDLERAWTAGRAFFGLDLSFKQWLNNYRKLKNLEDKR